MNMNIKVYDAEQKIEWEFRIGKNNFQILFYPAKILLHEARFYLFYAGFYMLWKLGLINEIHTKLYS